MGIDIVTYRQRVGLFGHGNRVKSRIIKHAYKPNTIMYDIHIRSFFDGADHSSNFRHWNSSHKLYF